MHPRRWRFSPRFFLATVFAICGLVSFAQTPGPRQEPVSADPRKNPQLSLSYDARGGIASDSSGRDSVVNLIVRLKTSPSARSAAGRTNQASQIKREHQEFLSKLGGLNSAARASGEEKTIKVVREYTKSFNGFTLKANRSFSDALRKMPHVISVTEDRKVKANDTESNEVIKVPEVWSQVGVTGEGMVIGIIDTGIDYEHPDLGGGFGSTHKVIAGYDFKNGDADPMDDHGHGTHVAGIAAADGVLKGVAPDAKLIAIKVLDANGYGYDSEILAGIEYAMDPDGDPETDDAPDVVNMSLGRSPVPNDPMSEAVNNAVLSGICFVIAAGNSYDYYTVGSPGNADHAITVGAIDNYENTAYFSSKGPLLDSFKLKPDIAAPGVYVNSTFLNSQYKRLDGTSMASPHVAGVAALILNKHPEWTPAEVKAAMMNTAKMTDLTRTLEIGAGIVDAHKAVTTELLMSPGSVSYGRPKTNEATWTRHDVITVSNKGQTSQSIQLALEGFNGPGISVQISPTQFVLAAGEIKEVGVDIEVNMATLENRVVPSGFYGNVSLTAGTKKLKTVLSMFNPTVTTFEFPDRIPTSFIIGGIGNGYWKPFDVRTHEFDVMLPLGTYDILARFGDSVVVVEDHEASIQSKRVVVDSRTASHKVEFKPVDANGTPIPFYGSLGTTFMLGPTTITMWFGPIERYWFSNTKKYKMYTRVFNVPANPEKMFEVALSTGEEINSSKVVTNDPALFREMKVTNPSIPLGQQQDFFFHTKCSGFMTWNTYAVKIPNAANIQLYEDPFDDTFSFYRFFPANGGPGFTWETTLREINPERGIEFIEFWETPIVTYGQGDFDFRLGQSLVNFTGGMWNTQENSTIQEQGPKGYYSHAYAERLGGTVTWTLKKNDEVLSSGLFMNPLHDEYEQNMYNKQLVKGAYKLTLGWDSYYVGGRFSKVTTDLDFDTNDNPRFDYNPPVIKEFVLKSDNKVTNSLEGGKGGTITIKATDYYPLSTTLEMKVYGTSVWAPVPLTLVPGVDKFTATLPTNIAEGLYSLRLKSIDREDNSITHTLDPAFAVGSQPVTMPFTKVSLILPLNYDVNAGVNPTFIWSSIPDAKYIFQLSSTTDFENEEELTANLEVTNTTYSLPAPLETDVTYYWRVKAKVGDVSLPWSKVFTFKASRLKAAVLLTPVDDAVDVVNPVTFTWIPGSMNEWQYIETSWTADFSGYGSYFLTQGVDEYTMTLAPGQTYYWRIRTIYFTYYNTYNIYSDVSSFKTKAPANPNPTNPNPTPTNPNPNPNPDPNNPGNPGDPSDPGPEPDPEPEPDPDPDVTTGLEDDAHALSGYPNPFVDRAYIRFVAKGNDVARLSVYDYLGRKVRSSQHSVVKGENIVVVESEAGGDRELTLSRGMYIVMIEMGGGDVRRVKVMKR